MPSLSYDSDLSNESYTSADGYNGGKNARFDHSEHIAKYIESHPMTEMFEAQKWNNIPIVVKEVLKMMCDAFMGQDIHHWERKHVVNKRLDRLQKMSHRIQKHVNKTRNEVQNQLGQLKKRGDYYKKTLTHEFDAKLDDNFQKHKLEIDKLSH